LAEAGDQGGEGGGGAVDVLRGGVAGEGEADGAVGDGRGDVHGAEDVGRFEAAGRACGAG